ncbi:MAG: mycofactocin-coupled SDR family oxidoreductase [Sporichthyaceae bacterium]
MTTSSTHVTGQRFAGAVVFITGVARGQGRSHAIRLAEEGADIIGVDACLDISGYANATQDDLAETGRLVSSLGRRAVLGQADVRDRTTLAKAVRIGVDELGAITHVIAQAGIAPLSNNCPAAFFDTADVNLAGIMHTVSATLPHLGPGAAIVATGSLASLLPGTAETAGLGGMGYAWAKQSLASYVHTAAKVLAPMSIRINAVHPTNVDTPMLQNEAMYQIFRPDLENPTAEDARAAFPAMNAMPTPWIEAGDVSDAVLFLLSEQARWITGVQLPVDAGGYVKRAPRPGF